MGPAVDILMMMLMALVLPTSQPERPAEPVPSTELLFVGDLSFAARHSPRSPERALDEFNPMRAFAARFEHADIVVANMEGLLNEPPKVPYVRGRTNIRASPLWAGTFAAAGVDVVGTANNHSWDGGARGLLENRRHLEATGVAVIGSGESTSQAEAAYVHRGPTGCIAVLPATLLSNTPPRRGAAVAYYPNDRGFARLLDRVERQRDEGCFVAVYIHWGREMKPSPGRWVRARAHRLIDAGASLVVGHHPHVLQGFEFHGDGVIAYSLGNFVFTNRNAAKRQTGVLSVRFDAAPEGPPTLSEVAFEPATIALPGFFVRPSTEREFEATHRDLTAYSRRWSTITPQGTRLVINPRSD